MILVISPRVDAVCQLNMLHITILPSFFLRELKYFLLNTFRQYENYISVIISVLSEVCLSAMFISYWPSGKKLGSKILAIHGLAALNKVQILIY